MQFRIGAFVYNVRRRWSLTLDGEVVDGYAAWSTRSIFIDGDLNHDMVEQTLRHEVAHCWEFETGAPTTIEDRANFTATVGAAFDQDWNAGGGLAGVLKLSVEGVRPTSKRRAAQWSQKMDRIECGRCGAQIMSGSIHTGPATLHEAAGFNIVERGCRCPVCDTVQVWTERATADGLPLGEFLRARLLGDAEADAWMAEHGAIPCPYSQC